MSFSWITFWLVDSALLNLFDISLIS